MSLRVVAPLSFNEEQAWTEFGADRETFFKRGALLRVPLRDEVCDLALRRLVNDLTQRHPLLRTAYRAADGIGVARELPAFHHEIRRADACEYPVDGLYPDRLGPEDLVRIWLTPGPDGGRVLYFDMNEMVVDTGSTARLDQDVTQYLSGPGGPARPANWAAVPSPTYRDFATRQRAGDVAADDLIYWRTTLKGMPASGTLPDEGADPSGDVAGERVWVLPDELTGTFREICRRHRTSGFMTAVGLVSVVFSALWDLPEVTLATASSLRPGDFQEVVGNFNSNVVLRTATGPSTSVSEAVDSARRTVLGALRHPVHHRQLRSLLGVEPAPARVHYLASSDHYHKLLDSKPAGAEWAEPAEFPGWPLEVGFAEDSAHRIAIWLQYDPRRFTHERVASMLAGFRVLLTALADGRDATVHWVGGRAATADMR
ncbi:condensation domain-containing protein [Kribbella sp. NPDC050820]|uniref:condensation domain-containing protein n=1 Tax=Kribbella sp. NPDC050820 TaxID=3155408 RepID=UPI0034020A0F